MASESMDESDAPLTLYWKGAPVGHIERLDGKGAYWMGLWKPGRVSIAWDFESMVAASLKIHYEKRIPVEVELGPDRLAAEIMDLGNGLISWVLRPTRFAGGRIEDSE